MALLTTDLGAAIDKLYQMREERLGVEKRVKEMKAAEQAARNDILQCLEDSGLQRASGGIATAGRTVTTVPIVTNWDALYDYISQNDRFDLLQKRISVTAWRENFDEGHVIPGTESVEAIDISLTRASR